MSKEMYMFPYCEKFKDVIDEQVEKITEEVGEIEEALDAFRSNNNTETFENLGMEILDVIHACETLLRNIYDDTEVEELRDKVIAKNEERGYYDAPCYEFEYADEVPMGYLGTSAGEAIRKIMDMQHDYDHLGYDGEIVSVCNDPVSLFREIVCSEESATETTEDDRESLTASEMFYEIGRVASGTTVSVLERKEHNDEQH